MARPRKIPLDTINIPLDAAVKAPEVFLLQDPTAKALKRILRVYSAEERDRLINRGWVYHG